MALIQLLFTVFVLQLLLAITHNLGAGCTVATYTTLITVKR